MSKITRTVEELENEINWLEENKDRIPRTTFFGDDNHEKIEQEVLLLRRLIGVLNYEESLRTVEAMVYDLNDDGIDVFDTYDWATGQHEDAPSCEGSWGGLVR